jgi:hypothetical protein
MQFATAPSKLKESFAKGDGRWVVPLNASMYLAFKRGFN